MCYIQLMDVFHQQIYLDLKKQIDLARLHQSHILVYSFVGSGASYLFKSLASRDNKLTYINDIHQTLGDYSLLDLSLADSLALIDKASLHQKCAILVNNGLDFHSPLLEKYKTHFYLSTPLSCRNLNDTIIFAKEINPNLTDADIKKIYKISEGVGKIIKYLSVNQSIITGPDDTLTAIVKDVISSLRGYSSKEIKNLGITLPLASIGSPPFTIDINFDLSFSEEGAKSAKLLTPSESKILQKILDNQGQISKEEVSDIKWGENKYDEFSDQAINKTIRRLNSKLVKHSIKTIPKVGFILEKNAS